MIRPLLFGGVAVYALLPIVAVLLYSLATRWTANVLPDGYTLRHWASALTDERLLAALLRSLVVAGAVVVIDILLVVPAAYWARVRNPRIRPIVEIAAGIPFALPYVVIAFGVLQLAGEYTPKLLGTPPLLLAAQAAVLFPFMYWAVDGAMAAAGIERLDEAARACGAGPLRTLREVVMPTIRRGIVTGSILVFAASFTEFAVAQVLIGAAFETVPLWSADALGQTTGKVNELAVITFVTFVLLFAMSVAIAFGDRSRAPAVLPGARAVGPEAHA